MPEVEASDGAFMPNDQVILDDVALQTNEPAPQDEQKLSMAEQMAEQLKEIRARDPDAPAADAAKSQRARDEKGKFAAGKPGEKDAPAATGDTKKEATAPASSAPSAPAVQPVAAAPEATAPSATAQPAPSSYTAEGKAEFAKASPALQREILKREADFHKGIEQHYKPAANYAQAMHKAIAPYADTIKRWGVSHDVAVQALFNADHKLTNGSPQEKLQAFAELARGYNIDLSQGLPQAQAVDPNFQYLQNEIQRRDQRLEAIERENQARAAEAERQRQASFNNDVSRLKQGKPHFDELGVEIGSLLQATINRRQAAAERGEQVPPMTDDELVNQAYEAALWQSPRHRAELLAKQQADAEAVKAKQRAEDAEKAKQAKQASSVNMPRRGNLPAQPQVGDVKSMMQETLANIRNR